jgi:hypothetical protein
VANSLAAVAPKILVMGLLALRQNAIMPRLVNTDYIGAAAQKGQVVNIPIPSAVATTDVAPGGTMPSTGDSTPTSAAIPLTAWKEAAFYLTDSDMQQVMDGFLPMQASEAIKSIANTIDNYLMGMATAFFGYTGTAGTTPFGANGQLSPTEALNAGAILNLNAAPQEDRRIVLDPLSNANALGLRALQDQSWRGNGDAIVKGQIGTAVGFDWYMDQNVGLFTAGSITTGLISKASTAVAVGVTSFACTTAASTGACSLKIGDVITFAGDTQTYVLTAAAVQASAATDVTINIYPGLKVAHVGSEAVTLKATRTQNIAFHRDAIAFVTRKLEDSTSAARELGSIMEDATDPVSGLTLRLEVKRWNKQTRWSWDVLYGAVVPRPELGCIIAG